jgi:putative ABC transport system permease protein
MAIGIDLSEDESVFKLAPWVVEGEGEYLTQGPHVMIGERMAKTLEAEAGGSLVWRARALGKEGGGSIQAELLKIEGIINTGNPAIDGAAIFIPLDYMQKSLLAGDRVTQVAVRIDSTNHLDKALESARRLLAPMGFEIKSWEDMGKAFLELHRLKITGNMIMVGVFLLIVMVGIINSMLMATYERVQEIGMLMAMGFRAREVRRLFLMEGAVLGMLGSILGIAMGAPLVWLSEVYGIPIDFFTGGKDVDMGYPIRGVMYGDLSLELVLVSFLGGILIAMAASAFPAWRASRMKPTEALRHV